MPWVGIDERRRTLKEFARVLPFLDSTMSRAGSDQPPVSRTWEWIWIPWDPAGKTAGLFSGRPLCGLEAYP
jgi:hypothetical protein